MQKTMNRKGVEHALTKQGMTRKDLAQRVGVSATAVTNWLQGKDFPRPPTLLKLAATLRLNFEELVERNVEDDPVIAFRKKGSAKTTDEHMSKAKGVGMLLKPLVPYLSDLQAIRSLITSPSTEYDKLQTLVFQARSRLGIGDQAVLEYEHLIGKFRESGAIVVPTLWGKKGNHENALHIRLPKEDVTFVFLNLDTHQEDFKFWMAHELAHVYTPELAGTVDGEDFADAFAGALLFPRECAAEMYREAVGARSEAGILRVVQSFAAKHGISLNTVFQQTVQYVKESGLQRLQIEETTIHKVRNSNQGTLVSEALFDPMPPKPEIYLAACENHFKSGFFHALRRMIQERGSGPAYVQQILGLSLKDAHSLYEELSH